MKKKTKVRFDEVKIGEYVKYYGCVYLKATGYTGVNLKDGYNKYFWDDAKVIPVTVTIKAKEK